MKTINLRDYYPAYTSDTFLEVQDEIIEALTQFKRDDHAYYERRRVHKAYYSLDMDDGIENAALYREPSPQGIYEKEIADQEFVRGHQEFIENAGKAYPRLLPSRHEQGRDCPKGKVGITSKKRSSLFRNTHNGNSRMAE
ncbi:hypothetical protein L9W92_16860 [Pelotomaculum terephthalicicum JT]|uniref:hypothetical protein n=1 Tax=Pelotomaculum TaxID=191373 RepID=UPI0009CB24EC|nr:MULTISPECIES: hypothetical protein [Pelotomaculum]MCG9969675.1 hypothetical protein [Pelotomaculum terephthalicicum JT]OPX84839.1 MAG: hypothetical protein A4E54_02758 [Pelotomaculum sp. PtaB.Bin117]